LADFLNDSLAAIDSINPRWCDFEMKISADPLRTQTISCLQRRQIDSPNRADRHFWLHLLCPLIFGFLLLITANSVQAAKANGVELGIAALSHGLDRVAGDDTGQPSLLGTTYFNFAFQFHVPVTDRVLFSPEILWMPDFIFPRKEPGSTVATSFFILGAPLTLNLANNFDLDGGLAFINYEVKGPGGTASLNNGNTTSTFALPSETHSSKTIGLILGGSYNLPQVRFALDTMTEGFLSNGKRTFSLIWKITYTGLGF
jgi:hypothetical protein